jgi:5-deoxy-glucuronate isomerase
MTSQWYLPAGSTATGAFDVSIEPGVTAGGAWRHTGLRVAVLAEGQSVTVATGDCEYLVLPLSGGAAAVSVEVDGAAAAYDLRGRASVWAGASDLVYVPRDATVTVTSVGGGRVALPFARARARRPVCRVAAAAVPIELRGAGSCSREVRNFGVPGVVEADSIIACEVVTPAGNWSSYPPHKHDAERPGVEAELEEIYWFQVRGAEGHGPAFGYQRVYGTHDRPISVLEEVHDDDAVLVPHGWHGPAMAPPGYDMYYLNVMAGPGPERAWLICDDPAHAWVRSTWADQPVDPRLPLA